MMIRQLPLAAALIALAALTFYFPGRTYLQSDTQIYIPMMERAASADPGVLAQDSMVTRPHTGLSLYDDIAVALRRRTGLSFEQILVAQQVVFRTLGVWGLWLIATALGLSRWKALFVAALASIGAAIAGPAVLTIEYEPVPRGFAMGATVLAIGLALHRRWAWAAAAAAVATVIHAPTTWPIWPALFLAAFGRSWWPLPSTAPADSIRELARASHRPLVPLARLAVGVMAAAVVLLIASRGDAAPQPIFQTIPAWLEQIQRLRASYNWISEWKWQYIANYLILAGVVYAAARRVRAPLWILLPPAIGLASMPLSWILLEKMKWALMPQFQPARAVLWITLVAVVLSAAAAVVSDRWWQRALWLVPVFWIPVKSIAIPETLKAQEALVILALAAIFAVKSAQAPMLAPVIFFTIAEFSGVHNYRTDLHTPELAQVSDWARSNTPADAVFLFADAGHGLEAGIFRAHSLRALYVDWKSGGQANYFPDYAREWKKRWDEVGQGKGGVNASTLAALGVHYAVFEHAATGGELVFRNQDYAVYRLSKIQPDAGRKR
ncbi:MAG: DUF6798 domain-containing protein [Bryobacteraceae bacterium]